MKKLATRDTLRHLKLLMEAAPGLSGVFKKEIEASAFATLLERLRALVAEHGAEPSVESLRATLFPHAQTDSRRVLFSNFRGTLTRAAEAAGRRFALVQPNLRGKATGEIACWFEGEEFSTEPDLNAAAMRSVAGQNRQALIHAPAAILTGESLSRITAMMGASDTTGRRHVRIFLSYAHKNDAFVKKLLDSLRDELAISKHYAFSVWMDTRILVGNEWHQDIQQALHTSHLCLAMLSPAFLASPYIVEKELPPLVAGRIPVVPVLLEPLDFDRHNLRDLDRRQFFMLKENQRSRAFSECTGEVAKRFVRQLAARIEERIPAALEDITRQSLSDPEKLARIMAEFPEIGEILTRPAVPVASSPGSAPPSFIRENLTRLISHILPERPHAAIRAPGAIGGLRDLTRIIEKTAPDSDPYSRFSAHARCALDSLCAWAKDPEGVPFAAVLGEIGSGKTTLLRMFTAAMVSDPAAPPVIFIDLRDYSGSGELTLENLLTEHLRRYDARKTLSVDDLIRAVQRESALIIFDGLDEKIISMSPAARQNFVRELWRILPADLMDAPTASGRGRLILSCRSHYFPDVQAQSSGYLAHDRGAVKESDYLAVIMLPWRDEEIREYLTRLLGVDKVDAALELIASIHNLKDLSQRPYLLSLIGSELEALEADRAAGHVINAAALYLKFTNRWLARDEEKHIFSPVHKRRLMEQLAADLWADRGAREWPWERVEEWLDGFLFKHPALADAYRDQPRTLLKQDFRTATLFLRPDGASDTFRFAHTSLQEYFLACHLARALRLCGAEAAAAWDLPPPSIETLDFLGQLLQGLPAHEHVAVIARLNGLLGDATAPAPARLAAFRYHLQARRKGWSAPDCPDLALAGLDLSGMEVHGFEQNPLRFGAVDVSGVTMTGASFEYMHCRPGAVLRGADLRGSRWVRCDLHGADFSSARVEGVFFRQCDLRETHATETDTSGVLLHLCETTPDSPWPVLPPPGKPVLRLQYGHTSAVESVAFSPDGHHVLSGSHDKTLKLWNIRSGHCIQTLTGHSELVWSVAFSPDGQFLASGSWDTTIKCWDARSGRCHQTLTGHSGCVTTVAFSADSHLLISGSQDKTIRLWDMRTMQCLKMLKGHSEDVMSVAFSRDGRHAISGSKDQTIKLWDVISCQCLQTFTGHSHWVNSVAFSPDGELILSGSEDDTLKLWDICSGQCLHTFKGHSYGISSVCFSPDGRYLLSASDDATQKVWDVRSRQCTKTLAGHSDVARSIAISHNENLLTSGSGDCTLKLWDTRSGQCLHSLAGHSHSVICATFSPEGGRIFCLIFGENDHCFSVGGQPLPVPEGTDDWFSPDSNRSGDLQLEVIGGALLRLRSGNTLIRDILPLPDGKSLVLEPLDAAEAVKPPNECRWKLVRGPADAWRHAAAIDLDTLAVHPLETVAPAGSWEVCD